MFAKDFGYCSSCDRLADIPLTGIGFGLVIIGIILAIVAVAILAFRSVGSGTNTRGAGVLLIGPIPIIFGTDRNSVKTLMILAIILIVAMLAIMLLPWLVTR
jgi:uncharacterized protein (TIGR00304 family)